MNQNTNLPLDPSLNSDLHNDGLKRKRGSNDQGENTVEESIQFTEEGGEGDEGDSDEEDGPKKKKGGAAGGDASNGRRKIQIEFIEDKSRRHITFSKRKAGIMKKAYELSTLTGTQVLLLVVSETGLVYTFTTSKLQALVTKPEGKNLIQACLQQPNPPDANGSSGSRPSSMTTTGSRSAKQSNAADAPLRHSGNLTPKTNKKRKVTNPNADTGNIHLDEQQQHQQQQQQQQLQHLHQQQQQQLHHPSQLHEDADGHHELGHPDEHVLPDDFGLGGYDYHGPLDSAYPAGGSRGW